MKKTLVAMAALAATGAFAQVTMTGVMDAGYQSGKEYGQDVKTVTQNGSRTTAIKFIGVEDLGGGLKAKFQFEADPAITAAEGNTNNGYTKADARTYANGVASAGNAATAQSGLVGNGYNYVMLESATLGSIEFGTINTNSLAAQGLGAQKFGTAVGSGYKKIWANTTRFENAWSYKTPVFNGFSATYLSGVGNDSAYSVNGSTSAMTFRRPSVNELGLNFDQGPVSVKLAILTSTTSANEIAATTTTGAASNVKTAYNTLAATYDFGVVKVGYGYQTTKTNTGADTTTSLDHGINQKASMYTITAPVGAVTLMGNLGSRTTNNQGGIQTLQTALNGTKSTFVGLGAHYNFSKNTYAYYMYERATMSDVDLTAVTILGTAGSNTNSDKSRNVTAIGISTAF